MKESLEDIDYIVKNSLNGICIPYMDFSITTKCSLKCKYCTQWNPYIKNKRNFSKTEIMNWLKNIFVSIDSCLFVTILGGGAISTSRFFRNFKGFCRL